MSVLNFEKRVEEYFEEERVRQHLFNEMIEENGWKTYNLDKQDLQWGKLDDACKKCIFNQIDQYKDSMFKDGSPVDKRFMVPCSGIPKDYVSDEIFDYLRIDPNSEEADSLRSARDPVEWGKQNCFFDNGAPWLARDYQEIMLRCSSKRVVFRCGRRVGKSDALAVLALFYCMTQPFYVRDPVTGDIVYNVDTGEPLQQATKVLCITPRQSHADNLMGKVTTFINNNPLLKNSVESSKKSPYYVVKFSNGSKITCLTAGTGTAGAGMNIRSFDADIMILDEANYLGSGELKAARAILATNANTMLRASSTPVGVHDFFWEWCNSKPGYKAFHFPSSVLPHWGQIKDEIYEDIDTEDEFLHEYMADFSPSAHGVFRPDLVKLALKDYRYEDVKRENGWLYSIGVDWNTNAGTEIVVTGYNNKNKFYQTVRTINVPKSEWTQLRALEALIDEIKYWQPSSICVDEGHGGTQIEVLKKYALEHGKSNTAIFDIIENLISYNFSSKIESVDPVTGEEKKKHAKPFLVNNAVRRFEEEHIVLSSTDSLLIKQLNHYEIANISPSGVPTYKCGKSDLGDHRLDAFMLSLMGFRIKYGNMSRRNTGVTKTGFIGSGSHPMTDNRKIDHGHDARRPMRGQMPSISSTEKLFYPNDEVEKRKYAKVPSRTRNLPSSNKETRQSPIAPRQTPWQRIATKRFKR